MLTERNIYLMAREKVIGHMNEENERKGSVYGKGKSVITRARRSEDVWESGNVTEHILNFGIGC
jgi:hypothetical protein